MAVIGLNLDAEHLKRADEIAAELGRRYRVHVSRSAAIRQAIWQTYLDLGLSAIEEVKEETTDNDHE